MPPAIREGFEDFLKQPYTPSSYQYSVFLRIPATCITARQYLARILQTTATRLTDLQSMYNMLDSVTWSYGTMCSIIPSVDRKIRTNIEAMDSVAHEFYACVQAMKGRGLMNLYDDCIIDVQDDNASSVFNLSLRYRTRTIEECVTKNFHEAQKLRSAKVSV